MCFYEFETNFLKNYFVKVVYDEDEDEDEVSLLNRVPEDTTVLQECITASQGCLLLLVLKQHLKDLYGLTDA